MKKPAYRLVKLQGDKTEVETIVDQSDDQNELYQKRDALNTPPSKSLACLRYAVRNN